MELSFAGKEHFIVNECIVVIKSIRKKMGLFRLKKGNTHSIPPPLKKGGQGGHEKEGKSEIRKIEIGNLNTKSKGDLL